MSTSAESDFKRPPTVQCVAHRHCLGIGRKIHNPNRVCFECLKRHDPQQLRTWANNNSSALLLIETEVTRKQEHKQNIEGHNRFLCAFEDPDYQHCPWRVRNLNLRGTRLNCTTVRKKGKACNRCWNRHLQKITILQYFTPTGLCHEEADKVVTRPDEPAEATQASGDDVEGYDIIFD